LSVPHPQSSLVSRQDEEARKRQATWQLGAEHAASNLKQIAKRRTDIFGSGDVEAEIGQRVRDMGDKA